MVVTDLVPPGLIRQAVFECIELADTAPKATPAGKRMRQEKSLGEGSLFQGQGQLVSFATLNAGES